MIRGGSEIEKSIKPKMNIKPKISFLVPLFEHAMLAH
jgi:hypothetical protein